MAVPARHDHASHESCWFLKGRTAAPDERCSPTLGAAAARRRRQPYMSVERSAGSPERDWLCRPEGARPEHVEYCVAGHLGSCSPPEPTAAALPP
eukprot:356953-Chlamydomonas_euryale.AAC.11